MEKQNKYEVMAKEIQAKLGDDKYEVSYHEVKKNNGFIGRGFAVKEKGNMLAPQFYVNDVEDDEVVDFVVSSYKDFMEHGRTPEYDKIKAIMSKDGILNNVFPAPVNRERNTNRLSDIPHRPYLDIEITYKINVGDSGFITVTNEMAEHFEITEDELNEMSIHNIQGRGRLYSILDMIPVKFSEEETENPPAFVITNEDKTCGAGMILDEEVIAVLEKTLHEFYIIPSSIHECIIVPTSMGDANHLKKSICEVNATMDERDVLSYSLYVCRDGKVEVA